MPLTDAVSKQKAFILVAGFPGLTDKLVLGVCTWPFREAFKKHTQKATKSVHKRRRS